MYVRSTKVHLILHNTKLVGVFISTWLGAFKATFFSDLIIISSFESIIGVTSIFTACPITSYTAGNYGILLFKWYV